MWIGIVLMPFRIRVRISIKMEVGSGSGSAKIDADPQTLQKTPHLLHSIRWWPVLPGIPLVIVDEVEELPDSEELLAGFRLAEGLEEGPHLASHHQVQVEHLQEV
jgi:hypothetical protein